MNPLLPLLLCCCQDPQPSGPAAPPALDVVELRNGDRFEGRITAQVDGYVEIQLEAGAVVGISIAQIAAVRRGAGPAVVAVPAALPPADEWFVLHDARGTAVGWLHASVTNANDGSFTVHEEYEFLEGRRRYQVTSLCTADARWAPRSCYFRERVSEPALAVVEFGGSAGGQADRIAGERIVEATCAGERLQVVRLDGSGRREREFEFAAGSTFPLLARARARATGEAMQGARLFDPASEELVVRSFDGARLRRVTVGREPLQVTELVEHSPAGRNSEWLDASLRTVRRELAGPALVAMPSSAGSVGFAATAATIPSAIVAEAGGQFGLWLPNPAWQPREDLPAGQIALVCEAHGATVGLTRLDHLEPSTPLESAADAVANWFRLLHADLPVDGRQRAQLRDRGCVRLLASGRAGGAKVQATVDVIPHADHFLVLVCRAPAAAWEELADDFDFLRRSIELEPQSLAPRLQGPIAERQAAPAAGAPRVARPSIVRVPKDG
ncbi:MAG: hypothetical protein KF830_02070 [Planctomycetes bacterium]|nr:hypothetical protein [Planctomycetota bacterium]